MSAQPNTGSNNNSLALIVIAVLGVMLVPMPPFVLDVLLCLNITISLLIMMTVLNTSRPTDFSTFPSILLFTALFRLALNVASTRLILLDANPGNIIKAFGDFVIGGEYMVGIIIFLILVIIQFVVITKGQNRISEVAARFTLDAMPGKQMAIDADLSAGLITNDEAKARRKELANEAEFYGAMDGAGKFVRGDAIAGIIITVINIIGGLLMGLIKRDMGVDEAFATYTILTVGDGLVTQIPSLLVSTAAGLLVTKSASEAGLGAEMGDQIFARPPAMKAVAGILAGASLMPGMPTLPFLVLAGGLFAMSSRVDKTQKTEAEPEEPEEAGEPRPGPHRGPARGRPARHRDRLSADQPGRRGHPRRTPGPHPVGAPPVRDHVGGRDPADPSARQHPDRSQQLTRVLLGGQVIAKGELRAGHYLAMDPSGTAGPIEGLDTVEPAFGLPAKWITENEKDKAEIEGHTVIDAPSVLVTHVSEVLKKVAGELLNRDDVKGLIDNLKKTAPTVVDELIPSQIGLGQLQAVLRTLLAERVPIRNLQVIMEAIADAGGGDQGHSHSDRTGPGSNRPHHPRAAPRRPRRPARGCAGSRSRTGSRRRGQRQRGASPICLPASCRGSSTTPSKPWERWSRTAATRSSSPAPHSGRCWRKRSAVRFPAPRS